jgi:hypothetical protein
MANAAFNRQMSLFTSKVNVNLRNKLMKCYIRTTALYGAEKRTRRKVDQKHLENSELRCWRRMEKISWTDRVRNKEILYSQGGEEYHIYSKK